jgi:hypothetical protein
MMDRQMKIEIDQSMPVCRKETWIRAGEPKRIAALKHNDPIRHHSPALRLPHQV